MKTKWNIIDRIQFNDYANQRRLHPEVPIEELGQFFPDYLLFEERYQDEKEYWEAKNSGRDRVKEIVESWEEEERFIDEF